MDNYINDHTIDEILVISEERPFPDKILSHAQNPFINRAYIGSLPNLKRYYCIVDNWIYFWSMDSTIKTVDEYEEKNTRLISFVFECPINNKYFNQHEVRGLIVYGTENRLKLVPVTDTEIVFDHQIEHPIDFLISCCYCNKQGELFLGTSTGQIYLFTYSYNKKSCNSEKKLKLLTELPFYKKFISFFLFDFPVIQICVDEESQMLAALHYNSIINFYHISDSSLQHVFKFKSTKFPCQYQQETIIRIASIPLSKNKQYQFVAFYSSGARIFFHADEFYVDVYNIRIPPPNQILDLLFDATILPTHTLFFYQRNLLFVFKNHERESEDIESYVTLPINSELLSVSYSCPDLPLMGVYDNLYFLQHISPPITIHVMTSTGTRFITLKMPYDNLFSILNQGAKQTESQTFGILYNWASVNYLEGMLTALLLAAKRPEVRKQCIYFIKNLLDILRSRSLNFYQELTSAHVFSARLERIAVLGWDCPLFEWKEDVFTLSRYFKNTNLNRVKDLADVKSLIIEYQNEFLKNTNNQSIQYEFNEYIKFCDKLMNIFTCISLMEKLDDSLITQCILKLEEKYKNRLINTAFGSDSPVAQSIVKTLHQFCMALYDINPSDDFLHQVQEKCSFFGRHDFSMWGAIKRIQTEPKFGDEILIQKDVDILVKLIDHVMNLDDIFPYLKRRNMMPSIIKLSIAKAKSIDPFSLALAWFRNDRTLTKDRKGIDLFDQQYRFFEMAFKMIEKDDDIYDCLNENYELFYICFYDLLIRNQKFDCVIKASKKAPFLKEFILKVNKKNVDEYLWKYYASRGKYEKAALSLYNYVYKSYDMEIVEILELLKKSYSYSCGNENLRSTIRQLICFCEIQIDFMERTDNKDDYQYGISSEEDLFSETTYRCCWDLSIRLFPILKINTANYEYAVSQLWQNFVFSDLSEIPLQEGLFKINDLFNHLKYFLNEPICKLELIVPIFEEFSLRKLGGLFLFFNFFLKKNYNINHLTLVYLNIASDSNLTDKLRCRYTDICAHGLFLGATIKSDQVIELFNWFKENGVDYDRYEEVLETFHSIIKTIK